MCHCAIDIVSIEVMLDDKIAALAARQAEDEVIALTLYSCMLTKPIIALTTSISILTIQI
jgi:hypothetical protein